MSPRRLFAAALALALVAGPAVATHAAPPAGSPGAAPKSMAAQIIKQVADVRQGDLVVIRGDVRDRALVEALVLEARRLGAQALPLTTRPGPAPRLPLEVPARYAVGPDALVEQLADQATVEIVIDRGALPGLLAMPAARASAVDRAAPVSSQDVAAKRSVRRIVVGNGIFPTAAAAKRVGVTRAQLSKLFGDGMSADPARLHATGDGVRAVLAGARLLQITAANGTDLTMRVAARAVRVNDGLVAAEDQRHRGAAPAVALPAGEVYLTPVPGTAEGVLVIDRAPMLDGEIPQLIVFFRAGKVVTTNAPSSVTYDRFLARWGEPRAHRDEPGALGIGINPHVRVATGIQPLATMADGMVTLFLGHNTWAGGANRGPFSVGLFLPGAVLKVDGKTLVDQGTLRLPP
ncbi:MAG TPA: aminopeptidase, partial [Polyangia bacterium]